MLLSACLANTNNLYTICITLYKCYTNVLCLLGVCILVHWETTTFMLTCNLYKLTNKFNSICRFPLVVFVLIHVVRSSQTVTQYNSLGQTFNLSLRMDIPY